MGSGGLGNLDRHAIIDRADGAVGDDAPSDYQRDLPGDRQVLHLAGFEPRHRLQRQPRIDQHGG